MKKISLKLWEKQDNYFGSDFFDYYTGPATQRNADILDQSNFEVALDMLGGEGSGEVRNPNYDPTAKGTDEAGNLYQDESIPAVRVQRLNHFAVGWIEVILVHKDAEDKVAILEEIENALADYSVLDDSDYTEKEWEKITEGYDSWGRDHVIDILNLEDLMGYELQHLSSGTQEKLESSLRDSYIESAESEDYVDEDMVKEVWESKTEGYDINFIYTVDGAPVGVWFESDIDQLKQDYGEDELMILPEHEPVSKSQMGLPFESGKRISKKKAQEVGKPTKYTFKTSELLENFDLPDFELDPGDFYFEVSDSEVRDVAEQYDIPEELLEDNFEIESGISDAIRFGYESGYSSAYYKAVKEALERVLETFSDYQFEYPILTDEEGYTYESGVAKGIIPNSIFVDYETTTFEAYPDLANIVQDCVAGYGMFEVDDDFEGEAPEDYARTRFHWLAYYWEIYGDRKPQPDLDRIDDFDYKYFEEIMETEVMPLVQTSL